MRLITVIAAGGMLAACATTTETGTSQSIAATNADSMTSESQSSEPVARAENATWDGETMVGGYRFVDGLPPEGQYNAVADESGTILRGVMVDSQGRICRRERVTGSNIPELRCRTPEQWQTIQEAGQDRIRHRQSTGYMFRGG